MPSHTARVLDFGRVDGLAQRRCLIMRCFTTAARWQSTTALTLQIVIAWAAFAPFARVDHRHEGVELQAHDDDGDDDQDEDQATHAHDEDPDPVRRTGGLCERSAQKA